MTDIGFNTKTKKFKQTGSSFDTTSPTSKKWPRVGGHRPATAPVDMAAFSGRRVTSSVSPKAFIRRGDGSKLPNLRRESKKKSPCVRIAGNRVRIHQIPNLDFFTSEVIYPFKFFTRERTRSSGKSTLKSWISITTCQSSLVGYEKLNIPTVCCH